MSKLVIAYLHGCLFIITCLLSSCSLFSPVQTDPVNIYTLSLAHNPIIIHCAPTNITLLVLTPSAAPGYNTAQMIYMECPYQLKAFSKNQWVAPPNQMIQPLLVQSLRCTGRFHAVVTAPYSGVAEYRLETQLLKFQHEFLSKPSQVCIVFHAVIINNANNQIVAGRTFCVCVTAGRDNPYCGVVAANKAVSELLNQVTLFVVSHI